MRIIAHRGASAEAPENTLAAFQRAVDLGVGMIELDVRLSADGVPVVIHDETLSRTTDGEGAVNALTLAEIRRYSAGSWFGERFREERVPTLGEVYDQVEDRAEINVEIKGDAASTAPASLALVESRDALGRTLFSSFDPHALECIRGESPGARLALLIGPGSLSPAGGHAPADADQGILAHADRCLSLGLEGANLHRLLATATVVALLHARGLAVCVFTVDGVREVAAMAGRGVDGVFSNDPAPLLDHWPARTQPAAGGRNG